MSKDVKDGPPRGFAHPLDDARKNVLPALLDCFVNRLGTLLVRGEVEEPINEEVDGHSFVVVGAVLENCQPKY